MKWVEATRRVLRYCVEEITNDGPTRNWFETRAEADEQIRVLRSEKPTSSADVIRLLTLERQLESGSNPNEVRVPPAGAQYASYERDAAQGNDDRR